MRQSMAVVLERNTLLSGDFTTEPYEAAWASEARWFVRALDLRGSSTRLEVRTQISPDGLHWCDLDGVTHELDGQEMLTWPVRDFGGWLRLKGVVTGDGTKDDEPGVRSLIYLVIKS